MKRYIKYFSTYARLWWKRLLNDWLAKLVALLLAIFLWSFVNSIQSAISQRNLTVPLSPLIQPSQIATGIPDKVEIVVSGKSQLIKKLKVEDINVVLDLLELEGKFKETVHVAVPLGISLVKVNPKEVIGTVESLVKTSLPVKVSFLPLNKTNYDFLFSADVFPQNVAALGTADLVEEAVAAIALTTAVEGDVKVPLYAANMSGQALSEINLRPSEVTLSVHKVPVLHSKELPIVVDFLRAENVKVQTSTLSKDTVVLVGANQQLENLTEVQANVNLARLGLGEHDIELNWILPEGVKVLEAPTVKLKLINKR